MALAGLHMDGVEQRTSNFMEHGTLAVKIGQEDYRSFLLTLYSLACYTADSGNRYSPEDALISGGYAAEGSKYGWSVVVNTVLQPARGLRWLLYYEECDADVCHLEKAAPKHWFSEGEQIVVERCPTRFGTFGWKTESLANRQWRVTLNLPEKSDCILKIHIHPADEQAITTASVGQIEKNYVTLASGIAARQRTVEIKIG